MTYVQHYGKIKEHKKFIEPVEFQLEVLPIRKHEIKNKIKILYGSYKEEIKNRYPSLVYKKNNLLN